ncbi:hypothetical protein EJB05_55163, partial [Eragrostis curvula]
MAKESSYAEQLAFIEEMTTNVDVVQERVLAEILGRNGDSEYLAKKCGLAGATDRAAFREKVPMVSYEDLQPYIRRIADGDRSPILTGAEQPVSEFLISSGTSGGECKLLPNVEDVTGRRMLIRSLAMAVISEYIPGLDKGTALYFHFVRSETMTPGGLPARGPHLPVYTRASTSSRTAPATCSVTARAPWRPSSARTLSRACTRRCCAVCAGASTWCASAPCLPPASSTPASSIDADIEAGVLNPRVTDQSVREAVAGVLLRPDPDLAQFIRAECSNKNDNWAGIVTRIWPNAKYLQTIVTGAMAQYVPTLNYYSGGLPVASTVYVSSECSFGINLRPLCDPSEVSYTIMPNMAYFEFLPMDINAGDTSHADLVELARVEVGREYEVVVTNYSGLNRYRVGDILCVTGFHNTAPQFSFVRRRNVLLFIDSDKTDEAELQRAVERASSALLRPQGAAVLDYTSRACTDNIPGHYVVYWELLLINKDAAAMDGDVLERCCLEMEEALNVVYRQIRVADGSIGPLEIRVVRPGTFEELMDHAISRGTVQVTPMRHHPSVVHRAA